MAVLFFLFFSALNAVTLFYLIAAILGGTVSVLYGLLSAFGGSNGDLDTDVDGDLDEAHGSSAFAGWLSVRALAAAVTTFGLAGLATASAGWSPFSTASAATVAALATMMLVVTMMRSLHGLSTDKTARIERAVGAFGTVYLPVGPDRMQPGKVHLTLQGRTVEIAAVTPAHLDPLPTGTAIRVVEVLGPNLVEVVPESPALLP